LKAAFFVGRRAAAATCAPTSLTPTAGAHHFAQPKREPSPMPFVQADTRRVR
jgi:hypothetical protein